MSKPIKSNPTRVSSLVTVNVWQCLAQGCGVILVEVSFVGLAIEDKDYCTDSEASAPTSSQCVSDGAGGLNCTSSNGTDTHCSSNDVLVPLQDIIATENRSFPTPTCFERIVADTMH